MNRGGVCGTSQTFATTSYNDPKDENGNSFTPPVVATWRAGEVVEIKFTITAHHKGAVSLGLCKSLDVSQACFDEHPLEFVEDSRYGAPPDPNHPERGYIAPDTLDQSNEPGSMEIPFNGGMPFTMKFRVPESVGECEHCVLQCSPKSFQTKLRLLWRAPFSARRRGSTSVLSTCLARKCANAKANSTTASSTRIPEAPPAVKF